MAWNKRRFESVILDDLEIIVDLPSANTNNVTISVSEEVKIYPVGNGVALPEHNSRTQFLNGPYWDFSSGFAVASYVAENLPIEAIKSQLKAEVANNRWKKEVSGVKVTIQGLEVTVDTERGSRDIFVQQFLLMGAEDTVMWKFPEGWLNLTKADLGLAVMTGVQHVKGAFVWEEMKIGEIELCADHAALAALNIEA